MARNFTRFERYLCSFKQLCVMAFFCVIVSVAGCGGSGGDKSGTGDPRSVVAQLDEALAAVSTDADFTLLVESADGKQYVHSRGNSTAQTNYNSASTSKMVAAAVILLLVQEGVMSLNDHPQDYLDFWPSTGNRAAIELHHLLNFTSGLNDDPACINNPIADFEDCVVAIADANPTISEPGDEFYYASSHLQVAALMAVYASGLADWGAVFDYFKARTGLFANASFDVPSVDNPRVAGGMHWRASEYLAFLRALYQPGMLSPVLIDAMTSDQLAGATIRYSPIKSSPLGLDWHYGYGVWIECGDVPFSCTGTTRVSSPGVYGAYPFIDFEHRYFGIIARQGTQDTVHQGYRVWASVENTLAEWAALHR